MIQLDVRAERAVCSARGRRPLLAFATERERFQPERPVSLEWTLTCNFPTVLLPQSDPSLGPTFRFSGESEECHEVAQDLSSGFLGSVQSLRDVEVIKQCRGDFVLSRIPIPRRGPMTPKVLELPGGPLKTGLVEFPRLRPVARKDEQPQRPSREPFEYLMNEYEVAG